ncbi:MAG: cytidine deaminase [Thermodesulfovibrionales bacterium]|nr:cytidine deaminase [Thermodesulfovibrionales bacterium]
MIAEKIIELINEAVSALKFSRPLYSGFRVGAAVLGTSGRIYRGSNFENPSLMMSLCAEKLAILKALSEGEDQIVAIAIASGTGDYCLPCGSCRQFILEFSPEIDIYINGRAGIKKYSISELLPEAFRPDLISKDI